jgi:hypothetical protein
VGSAARERSYSSSCEHCRMRRFQLLAFAGLIVGMVDAGWGQKGSAVIPMVDAHQATVIAFYPRQSKTQSVDADANESLSDFQLYDARVEKPLTPAGIQFKELYSSSFRVHIGVKTRTFHPTSGVCYYFVAPGKRPHVEYGVMTDTDLLQVAKRYFGFASLPN